MHICKTKLKKKLRIKICVYKFKTEITYKNIKSINHN